MLSFKSFVDEALEPSNGVVPSDLKTGSLKVMVACELVTLNVNTVDMVGAVVSITISFPLNIFVPVGSVVEFITFPTVSSTVPCVKTVTAKPEEV